MVQLKDLMTISQLINSMISDFSKHCHKIQVILQAGPPVMSHLSVDKIHIQEDQRPASARTNQYILQISVPTMVKIASAQVTLPMVLSSAKPRRHLTSRDISKKASSQLLKSKTVPRVLHVPQTPSEVLTQLQRIRTPPRHASVMPRRRCSTRTP